MKQLYTYYVDIGESHVIKQYNSLLEALDEAFSYKAYSIHRLDMNTGKVSYNILKMEETPK